MNPIQPSRLAYTDSCDRSFDSTWIDMLRIGDGLIV
jgi:hypothetical protein